MHALRLLKCPRFDMACAERLRFLVPIAYMLPSLAPSLLLLLSKQLVERTSKLSKAVHSKSRIAGTSIIEVSSYALRT